MTISALLRVYALSVETIYLDSLFALNAIIDYFLLLCSARVAGAVLHRWRLGLAAVLGGFWAVASVLPGFEFLSFAPMKLVPAVFMALVAFGGERKLWRCLVIFLAVSAAFGGAVWAASMLAGTGMYGGRVYLPVSTRVLVLSFALCYAGVSLVFRRIGKRAEREILPLAVTLRGKNVTLRALRDTGNGLYDPVSGRAVAVAELGAIRPLLGGFECTGNDAAALCETLCKLSGLEGRVTLVPYSALGTGHGLLAAIRPDSAAISGKEADILIGISPAALSQDGDIDAIL